MIILTAYQTTIVLPNPEWSDSEQTMGEIIVKRSMNGETYTYVKTKNQRRKLVFRIQVTRFKSLELRAFIKAYYSSELLLEDHQGERWYGHLLNNPFEFETTTGEWRTMTLEFEGIKQ